MKKIKISYERRPRAINFDKKITFNTTVEKHRLYKNKAKELKMTFGEYIRATLDKTLEK